MSQTVSQLIGEIEARGVDEYVAGVRRVGAETTRAGQVVDKSTAAMGAKMQAVGGKMQAVGGKLTTRVTVPLALLGAGAVKAFSDFDSAMTGSLAIMAPVSDAMRGAMEKTARDIGKSTKVGASQAAEAYFFLASAGMDAQQSMAALPQVAKFAQAGLFDMAMATDLATDAQSALGLAAKEPARNLANLTRVTDVFVKANELANTSVQQISEAMTNKAGAALRALGKDVEEGSAVLAAFADQGVKGVRAGEQLTIVTRDLQTAALKNKDAFRSAGVAVYDANGKMRNYADIVQDLEGHLDGMTDAQKKTALATLGFTDESQSALITLLGTSKSIRRYEKELRKAGGATDRVANNQMKSFGARMTVAKNNVVDLAISVGEVLAPWVERVGDMVAGAASKFGKMSPAMQKLVVLAAVVVGAIGPLVLAGGTLVVMLGAMSAAAAALGVSLGVLIAVPLLVVAAIAGLVAAIVLLWKHSDAFRAGSKKIWGEIQKTFETTFAGLQATIQTWVGWARAAWAAWGAQISQVARSVWSGIASAIRGYLGMIRGVIQTVLAVLRGDWSGAWNGMKQIVSGAMGVIRGVVAAQGAALRAAWGAIWSGLRAGLVAAWGGIKSAAANHARGAAVAVLNGMTGGLAGLGARLLAIGKSAMQQFANGIKSIHIPTPHVDVSWGKASKGGVSIPVPKMDIDWYAKGGVFSGKQVIGVGEYPGARQNPEVVAPLSKLRDMMTPSGGGGRPIQITITGNTISKDMDLRRIGRELIRELKLQGVG